MTIEEVVPKVLREEHGDVIRKSVRVVARELMEGEVSELIGAHRGERSEDRATHRNGYRPRRWDTRRARSSCRKPAAGEAPCAERAVLANVSAARGRLQLLAIAQLAAQQLPGDRLRKLVQD